MSRVSGTAKAEGRSDRPEGRASESSSVFAGDGRESPSHWIPAHAGMTAAIAVRDNAAQLTAYEYRRPLRYFAP